MDRQKTIERMLHDIFRAWMKTNKKTYSDDSIEFTFPELTKDERSSKMKDLALSESMNWISHKTASTLAAGELQISTFDYESEQQEIKVEKVLAISDQYKQIAKGPQSDTSNNTPSLGK